MEEIKENQEQGIMSVLEQAQATMGALRQEMINRVNEKIMPIKAQKELRKIHFSVSEMANEIVLAWYEVRKVMSAEKDLTPTDIVHWNEALVEIISRKIQALMDSEEDTGWKLINILAGRELDENSQEDGVEASSLMDLFAGYMAEVVKKKFIELQEVMVGKSLMKLQETASMQKELITRVNGLKSQQSEKSSNLKEQKTSEE